MGAPARGRTEVHDQPIRGHRHLCFQRMGGLLDAEELLLVLGFFPGPLLFFFLGCPRGCSVPSTMMSAISGNASSTSSRVRSRRRGTASSGGTLRLFSVRARRGVGSACSRRGSRAWMFRQTLAASISNSTPNRCMGRSCRRYIRVSSRRWGTSSLNCRPAPMRRLRPSRRRDVRCVRVLCTGHLGIKPRLAREMVCSAA